VSALVYELPEDRIAQQPPAQRGASRLLLIEPNGALRDHRFVELPSLLRPGDICVANETRVRKARLIGRREQGGRAELLVLRRVENDVYLCLVKPARRMPVGLTVSFDGATGLSATVVAEASEHPGARLVRFSVGEGEVDAAIENLGSVPVPPYIRKPLHDGERYQTVFAHGEPASAAAPTAGLHFTGEVIDALRERGIGWVTVRLDVGLATFAPMREDEPAAHQIHEEFFAISGAAAAAINAAHQRGGRVIAVGTTTVRAVETQSDSDGTVHPGAGTTRLFIERGYRFRAVDGLLTNFHQPRSTLLALLAAFTGETWRAAYSHALDTGYRFLSFGDCMLCWRSRP
jgi:S-adenosylmethionine:tRNA ribosyltransferase-isomerase